jgi:hypothetical protein
VLTAVLTTGIGSAPAASAGSTTPTSSAHGLGATRPTVRRAPLGAGSLTARTALAALPAAVDLRRWAVTPGNQGTLNSCVPWAVDYALLGWYSRFSGRVGQPFAPMYTYSQINGGRDNGSKPIAALDLAVRQGNDTRAHYTKSATNWKTLPTASERRNAARYRVSGYTVLFSGARQSGITTALKTAIAAKKPVAIMLAVRRGFTALGSGSSAVDNDISTTVRGYHEVVAMGYDSGGLVVQNSWGTGWANKGFGRISWRVVQKDVWEAETIAGFVAS